MLFPGFTIPSAREIVRQISGNFLDGMFDILIIGHAFLILLDGELIPADFTLLYLTIILAHETIHGHSP